MPYKISGSLSDASRIIIIKESDWSIESNTTESVGSYEINELVSGNKLVAARKSDGESLGYGSVTPEYYAPSSRGVFGGGNTTGATATNVVDYITIDTTSNATDFGDLTVARRSVSAVSNGSNDRGVFGGGRPTSGYSNVIDYITISSTGDATDFGDMEDIWVPDIIADYASASNGTSDRGIFAGGLSDQGTIINSIHYITISSTSSSNGFGQLTQKVNNIAGTSNGTNDRGVFIGGFADGTSDQRNVIDYITISSASNSSDFGDLTAKRQNVAAVSNTTNNRGVSMGGYNGAAEVNIIEYITISSTGNATDFGDLLITRRLSEGTSSGTNNRGVAGGGYVSGSSINVIDYITISNLGNSSDFGDLTVTRNNPGACSNAD